MPVLENTDTEGKEEEPDTGEMTGPGKEEGDVDTGKAGDFTATGFLLNNLFQTDLGRKSCLQSQLRRVVTAEKAEYTGVEVEAEEADTTMSFNTQTP